MRGWLAFTIALVVGSPVALGQAPPSAHYLLPDNGPVVPGVGLPVATLPAIVNFLHTGDFVHHAIVDTPVADWNRVILIVHSKPNQDPWDRTLRVGIAGTQVLHGTTTRGDFTIHRDITEYASLLRSPTADIWTRIDSFVCCGIFVDVTLEFYNDPVGPAQKQPFDRIESPMRMRGMGIGTITATYTFADQAPGSGVIEFFTSGHGQAGEFWWMNLADHNPPQFDLYVDDAYAGTVLALPYIYALIGFGGGGLANTINQLMWTPAQTIQDAAGVHFVSGQIPPYRAQIPDDVLPLLSGTHVVKVVHTHHGGFWWASMNFLVNDEAGLP
jgi:hypothetical protein